MIQILQGDALAKLREVPDESVQCCVTSPPYWGLRDYGCSGQIGLERTPEEFIVKLVAVFSEVRRVLKNNGTLWVNMGDSYANGGRTTRDPGQSKIHPAYEGESYKDGLRPPDPAGIKPKDLIGQPWMLAFALRADGWHLRKDIIWHKPCPMPESVKDRPTTAHEYIFLLTKSERYYYDFEAIKEPVTGNAHPRGHGINPKAVSGWDTGPGSHSPLDHCRPGGSYKGSIPGRKDGQGQERRSKRPRQNPSFSAAISRTKNSDSDEQFSHRRMNENTKKAREAGGDHDSPFGETRNKRSVWTVPSSPYSEAHFATYPPDLIKPCILAGTRPGDTVLDPFGGSGTTGMVAIELGRKAVLIELNPDYIPMIERRCNVTYGLAL